MGETLDIAGLVVTGTYSDSSTKAETITTANISGFNSSTVAASQTLTVTLNGKMTSYVISIVKKAGPILTGVTADNVTNKVTGMAATMEFSTDAITWVKYNETIPNLPDLTGDVDLQVRFASTDTHEAGPATIFNFTAATLESIAVKTPATKLVYKAGEALDITGLVIEGTYSDASKKNVAITVANVTGFDSSAVAASQTLTVTVDGKTPILTHRAIILEGDQAEARINLAGKTGKYHTAYIGTPIPDFKGKWNMDGSSYYYEKAAYKVEANWTGKDGTSSKPIEITYYVPNSVDKVYAKDNPNNGDVCISIFNVIAKIYDNSEFTTEKTEQSQNIDTGDNFIYVKTTKGTDAKYYKIKVVRDAS